CQQHNYYPYTF
nr:immunoglobulin light chain junction region [Macaca mulatta]MOV64300.1 immunoglobulin light chain junction region [Macaca mulatta]